MNVNLNPGGFLGALLGSGIPIGYVVATGGFDDFPSRWVVTALVLGALAGNTAWAFLFKGPEDEPPKDFDRANKPRRERD